MNLETAPTRPRVAHLGEPGSFSEEAARRFVSDCVIVSRKSFEHLFAAIDDGAADLLVAPLENSTAGIVRAVEKLLSETSLAVVSELVLPIKLCLISCAGATFDKVRVVASHPVALQQCARFFGAHPHLTQVAGDDTASCVRSVVETRAPTRAAIASRRAAEIHGGIILRTNLEDAPDNRTRFALLAKSKVSAS